uniref:Uncharacterized protein n=1 Tax=Mustela putorius furo TaxID=9669 RepID=M3YL77_MUSPF
AAAGPPRTSSPLRASGKRGLDLATPVCRPGQPLLRYRKCFGKVKVSLRPREDRPSAALLALAEDGDPPKPTRRGRQQQGACPQDGTFRSRKEEEAGTHAALWPSVGNVFSVGEARPRRPLLRNDLRKPARWDRTPGKGGARAGGPVGRGQHLTAAPTWAGHPTVCCCRSLVSWLALACLAGSPRENRRGSTIHPLRLSGNASPRLLTPTHPCTPPVLSPCKGSQGLS